MAFIDLHPALTGQNTCRWVVGQHLETVTASPAFAALVGTSQDRLAGAPWYVLMTAASRDELERLCESRGEGPSRDGDTAPPAGGTRKGLRRPPLD